MGHAKRHVDPKYEVGDSNNDREFVSAENNTDVYFDSWSLLQKSRLRFNDKTAVCGSSLITCSTAPLHQIRRSSSPKIFAYLNEAGENRVSDDYDASAWE